MNVKEKWIQYFTRLSWTPFSCSLRESWKTSDKVKTFPVLLYTLIEGLRLCYAWKVQEIESSLKFLAIYHPIGFAGRMCTLVSAISILESFVLQSIVCFHRKSLLQFESHMTQDKDMSFKRECNLVFKMSYWLLTCTARFFEILAITCAFFYMCDFSFSGESICLSICAAVLQIINSELMADIYIFYWLWFVSTRKLSYSISSLFSENDPSITDELQQYTKVSMHSFNLNQMSRKLSTTIFVFGCVLNTGMVLMVYSLPESLDTLALPVALPIILGPVVAFTGRLIYFIGAATPFQQSMLLRDRIYRILFHMKNVSWKDRRQLLDIIKSQGCFQGKLGLTTIDGRLLETKLIGYHIVYSVRVFVLLLKVIKS